jgi:prevent-host-death family protein
MTSNFGPFNGLKEQPVHIPVSDAKAQLTDLVRRAEAGEEVILTRHGNPAVRLVPVAPKALTDEERARRRRLLEAARGCAKDAPAFKGVGAARAADFLYDDDGLPA